MVPVSMYRAMLTGVAVAALVAPPFVGAQTRGPSDSVTLRIVFPSAHADTTPQQLRLVSLLSRTIQPRKRTGPANYSPDKGVLEWSKLTEDERFKNVEKGIQDVASQLALLGRNGPIRGVGWGPTGTWGQKPANAYFGVDGLTLGPIVPLVLEASGGLRSTPYAASSRPAVFSVAGSFESSVRILDLTIPEAEMAAYLDSLTATGGTLDVDVVRRDFEYAHAVPASPPVGVVSHSLGPQELSAIATQLRNPVRSVPLVILETVWPTAAVAASSCAAMATILARIRTAWGIVPPKVAPCSASGFIQPLPNDHSRQVLESIQALQATAPDSVSVIFVPLGNIQGAAPLLAEIVRVGVRLGDKIESLKAFDTPDALWPHFYDDDNPATWAKNAAVLADTTYDSRAEREAKKVVESLPKGIPGTAVPEGLWTSAAILKNLVTVLSWDAFANNRGAVVSLSWTTTLIRSDLSIDDLTPQSTVIVAAVGNSQTTVTDPPGVAFGSRVAVPQSTFLAAINVNAARQLTCSSSVVDTTTNLADEAAASFDGAISGNCGTSFSAPRIAWLAAAAEALRPRGKADRWSARMLKLIRSQRPGPNPTLADIALDPIALLTKARTAFPPP